MYYNISNLFLAIGILRQEMEERQAVAGIEYFGLGCFWKRKRWHINTES